MKKVTNNIFKACAILLLAAGAAMPAQAQEAAGKQPVVYKSGQHVEVGDTVRIDKDQHRYVTGQRMSKWVYSKSHVVRQVGGKRYPNAVLLRGIYSWVYPYSIYPVTPKAPVATTINITACDKYYWEATGQTYTQSGEYTFKGKTVNGADSTVLLVLTINPNAFATAVEQTACGKYHWDLTGQTYTQSGEYTYKTIAANGCDSIVTLKLNILQSDTVDVDKLILPRHLPYKWYDSEKQSYITMKNIGDTSRVSGQNDFGCDVIENLHLSFKKQKRYGKDIVPVVPGWLPNLPYDIDRFTLGFRGGFASNLAGEKLPLGAGAGIDFSFAHYWVSGAGANAYGIKAGLNVGYLYTTQEKDDIATQQFTANVVNDVLDYTVSLDHVAQQTHQVQLEIPVMFAMQTNKGLSFNVGPKFIIPVYSVYHQTLTNPVISATGFPGLPDGYAITNEVVTGKVPADRIDYTDKFLVDNASKLFSLALGAELGYNIPLVKYGQSIDIGIYADYSIINAYKNTADPTGKVITVTPTPTVAGVDVQSLSTAYSNKFGYMNFGVKVAFNFDSWYYFQ